MKLIKWLSLGKKQWKDVIAEGVQILVDNNCATKVLAEKIIEATHKYGPYYVIAPDVALLHAEPGEWCLKNELSLMILDKNVFFSDNEENQRSAKIIFTLSAVDGSSHISKIQKLAIFLMDEKNLEDLIKMSENKKIDYMKLEKIWK